MSKKSKGLGKGLSALIPEQQAQAAEAANEINQGLTEIAITDILPNPSQPRKNFTAEALAELAQSIGEHGVLQPLVVRELPTGKFEIVAGERRWRASKQAGLERVPVVIKNLSDLEAMQIAIIENIQRQDLNPIEEAEAFHKLINEYSMTQEEMAQKVGKSRPYITNSLRLLGLNKIVRSLLAEGKISNGHARALITLSSDEQLNFAERILTDNLSVRETEKLIAQSTKRTLTPPKRRPDADVKAFENNLRTYLGTKVSIKVNEKGGHIEIHYYTNDDLLRISDLLLSNKD